MDFWFVLTPSAHLAGPANHHRQFFSSGLVESPLAISLVHWFSSFHSLVVAPLLRHGNCLKRRLTPMRLVFGRVGCLSERSPQAWFLCVNIANGSYAAPPLAQRARHAMPLRSDDLSQVGQSWIEPGGGLSSSWLGLIARPGRGERTLGPGPSVRISGGD